MNRRLKNILFIVSVVILTACAVGVIIYAVNKYKEYSKKDDNIDISELESKALDSLEMPEDIKNAGLVANVGDIEQPNGYGVVRKIENLPDMDLPDVEVGIGDIDFNVDASTATRDIKIRGNYSDEEKKGIASAIKRVDDEKYECYVSWHFGDAISESNYSILVVACGMLLEDRLNREEAGRYSVVADILTPESMEASGLVACYEIDEWGYITIAADITIQDLNNMTEIQEIRTFKVYFDGEYLTFAE